MTRTHAISTPKSCQDRKVAAIQDAYDRRGLRVLHYIYSFQIETTSLLVLFFSVHHLSLIVFQFLRNIRKLIGMTISLFLPFSLFFNI